MRRLSTRRAAAAVVAVALLAAGCATSSKAQGRSSGLASVRLHQARSFALALGLGTVSPAQSAALGRYDVVVLDSSAATPKVVAALHHDGATVLAYLSVGTIEPGRSWTASLAPYRLDHWDRWDEYYARASSPAYRRIVAGKVAPEILRAGVDGLFLDNVDMVATHPKERAGMKVLVDQLADLAHGQGRLLMAKNGDETVGDVIDRLDGWNREDVTSTYDPGTKRYVATSSGDRAAAVAALKRFKGLGVLVTTTDYVATGDRSAVADARTRSCGAGAVPFTSNIDLTRIAVPPLTC